MSASFWAWCGLDLVVVALAYALDRPALLGKRGDGSIASWARLLLAPYFTLNWLCWQATRLLSREPCCAEISPGIWLGRKPYAWELPSGVGLVVDLAAEFAAGRGVAQGRIYLCLPVLDGRAPRSGQLVDLIERVAAWQGRGIYIHCALGHGRSALVAAALLLRKGLYPDEQQAAAAIAKARPQAGLNAGQRAALSGFCQALRAASP